MHIAASGWMSQPPRDSMRSSLRNTSGSDQCLLKRHKMNDVAILKLKFTQANTARTPDTRDKRGDKRFARKSPRA